MTESNKIMNVIYEPFSGEGNEYSENMRSIIESVYGKPVSVSEYFHSRPLKENTDTIFLNWFEDLNSKKQWKNIAKYIIRSIMIDIICLNHLKIVYVMHNISSHDHRFDSATLKLRKKLSKKSSAIMILCDKSKEVLRWQLGDGLYTAIENKIVKVSLPNYKNSCHTAGINYRERYGASNEDFVFLFTGAIRPYKRIELISRLALDMQDDGLSAKIVVAGKASDDEYLNSLVVSCGNCSNITFMPFFIPAEEIYDLIASSTIALLPYDIKSSLNSSSCILALSCGRNIVIPNNGTVGDFPEGLAYSYAYTNEEDEYVAFKQAAYEAYNDYKNNGDVFISRQNDLVQFVDSEHSIDTISAQCRALFSLIA